MRLESNLFKWGHRVCYFLSFIIVNLIYVETWCISSVTWTYHNMFLHLLLKNISIFSTLAWVQILLLWIWLDTFSGAQTENVGSVHTAWKCWIQRWYQFIFPLVVGFPGGAAGNESANARDTGLIPGTGRSPGGGNGNPLQYFCLENSVDRGASWARVRGVAESWTQLSTAQPPQCGWAPAALHLDLAVFFFCHPGENIIVHHCGFNLHFSFKKWFSTFLLELSIQNLSLAQEEGKSWKGRSGFYWFIVLYPFWIWILCLTYIEYTPNTFLSTVCPTFSLSWQSFMIKRHF